MAFYFLGAAEFLVFALYAAFVLSRQGTPGRAARLIRRRVPQLPWLFLVSNGIAWGWAWWRGAGVPQTLVFLGLLCSFETFYWALRVGTWRFATGVFALGLLIAAGRSNPVETLIGAVALAAVLSLLIDEFWNEHLKKIYP